MSKNRAQIAARATGQSGSHLLDTPVAIQRCFRDCLEQATAVEIAVAWARPGWALNELERAGLPVHALVGRAFDMTHPDALESLMRLGNRTWVAPDSQQLFHPKVYLFLGRDGSNAIVGSVNLTQGAFMSNREAAVHLRLDSDAASAWQASMDQWRSGADPVTSRWLAWYRSVWTDPKSGRFGQLRRAEDLEHAPRVRGGGGVALPELLTAAWPDYERMLRHAARTRFDEDALFPEDPENLSYTETLRVTRPILRKPLPDAGTPAFLQLLGGKTSPPIADCGFFGRLTANGQARKELATNAALRRDIDRLLPEVRAAKTDREVLQAGERLFQSITRRERLRMAVVTRLLTLARPDRFFSLNGASERELAQLLRVSMTSLHTWHGYEAALGQFWSTPWYASGPPRSEESRELWDGRVALIDVLVYTWRM
ncbi:MAG: phospholipase D family protein [Phycisphaerales bacterium]|nr:phospholipase D family protein [Phycisphaerales bacterium]